MTAKDVGLGILVDDAEMYWLVKWSSMRGDKERVIMATSEGRAKSFVEEWGGEVTSCERWVSPPRVGMVMV